MKLPRFIGRKYGLLAATLIFSAVAFAPHTVSAAVVDQKCAIYLPATWLTTANQSALDHGIDMHSGNGTIGVISTITSGTFPDGTYLFLQSSTGNSWTFYTDGSFSINGRTQNVLGIPITGGTTLNTTSATVKQLQPFDAIGTGSCFYGVQDPQGARVSTVVNQTKFPYQTGGYWAANQDDNVTPQYETTADLAPVCPTGKVGTYPDCTDPPCPTGTTGTPPNCLTVAPTTTAGSSTGSSTTDDLTPRDIKLIGWSITLALSFIIIRSFRWRSYE